MRHPFLIRTLLIASIAPIACVTINVYFPEAAADKVAGQFVDKVIGDAPAATGEPAKASQDATNEPPPPPAHRPPAAMLPSAFGRALVGSASPPTRPTPAAMLLDLLIANAHAQDANLNVQSPKLSELQSRMRARFSASLTKYVASGALGFANDGTIALRDPGRVPLAERAELNAALADENRDRAAVYREIAAANGHSEWEAKIRATFAKQWIERAKPGWYYQDAAGNWLRK